MQTLKQDNINYSYSHIANNYAQYAFLHQKAADELLSRLDLIQIDIHEVLELGCGVGNSVRALSKQFPKSKLSFVDSSSDMLKIANLMLQDCLNPDDIFKEVQRITRENGLFTFSTFGPDSFKELRSAAEASKLSYDSRIFGHLTDMHDLGDALLRSGLREPVMDVDIFTLSFSSIEALLSELTGSGCVKHIFNAQEISSLSKNYSKIDDDDHFHITFEVVYGQAWAGDGISRVRSPEEVHFSIDQIGLRQT